MKTTSHSEYLELQSVFIKSAESSFVSNEMLEQQWKDLNYLSKPEYNNSIKEYENFESILKENANKIEYFPVDESVSIDSIYCRDASIVTDFGVILCNMGKAGRKQEPNAQMKAYKSLGVEILGEIKDPGTLEGGDVCWLDESTIAVGRSYRTNEEGIIQLKKFLEPRGIEVIVAELPHYKGKSDVFHLMSILSPVDKDLAVVYSPLMPINFRNELITRGFKLIEVPHSEFETMGCNVLAVSPRECLMVEGNPITEQSLREAGCNVTTYRGLEISVKGGGGPTCLTRPITRTY